VLACDEEIYCVASCAALYGIILLNLTPEELFILFPFVADFLMTNEEKHIFLLIVNVLSHVYIERCLQSP
jgi:hypothetical protein